MLYLLLGLAIPRPPGHEVILTILAVAAASIVYSMEESIREIARGWKSGWAVLLGNCFYAVVVTPLITAHGWLALEMRNRWPS